jgi:deoxycytidine triphosphate deaminase
VLFFESDEECQVSYADKKGKYQRQTGITLPKVPAGSARRRPAGRAR